MSKPTTVYDAIDRLHGTNAAQKRRRPLRFRLRSLLLLMTAVALYAAFVGRWGTTIVNRVVDRWQQAVVGAADPAEGLVVFACVLGGVLIGPAIFGVAYCLGEKRGFVLFSTLLCLGLLALVAGLTLDTKPLRETELQNLQTSQITRAALLWFASIFPVSACLGWYAAAKVNEE